MKHERRKSPSRSPSRKVARPEFVNKTEAELLIIGAAATWEGAQRGDDIGFRRQAEDLLIKAVKAWQAENMAAVAAHRSRKDRAR